MSDHGSHREPLEELAEEYLERLRGGEQPELEEFIARNPQLAEEIRDLFPTLAIVESLAPSPGIEGNSAQMTVSGELRRVGEYRIIREIGRGGMGVVYEAEQESLGRHVALKVLRSHGPRSHEHEERFQLEARAAAHLHHTNIVPVFAVGEEAGLHFYAMQFIRGQGLDEVMKEVKQLRAEEGVASQDGGSNSGVATLALMEGGNGAAAYVSLDSEPQPEVGASQVTRAYPHTWSAAHQSSSTSSVLSDTTTKGSKSDTYYHSVARVGLQVAEALAYSHREGILHRDIKPSNLLIDTNGEAWVTDFGLAKINDVQDLTQSGDVVGTLRYLAPERLSGHSDARSDVYSLGLTLYELVALSPAYQGLDKQALIANIAKRNPIPLHRRDPRVPRDLQTVIEKSIARAPSDRYQGADDLAQDLRRFLEYRPVRARRVSLNDRLRRWCRRNPAVAVCLGLIGLLLTAVAVISSVYAVRMQSSVKRTSDAELRALRQLAFAKLREGSARRRSGKPGQRLDSLDALTHASQLAKRLVARGDDLEDFKGRLRNEWIAALALTDVKLESRWRGASRVYAPNRKLFAMVDEAGSLEIRTDAGLLKAFSDEVIDPGGIMGWSRDGRWLALYLKSKRALRVVDVQTLQWLPGITPKGARRSLAFAPDSQSFACGYGNDSICFFSLPNLEKDREPVPTRAAVADIAWSDDHRLAYCHAHRSSIASVVDLKDPEQHLNLIHGGGVESIAFHPVANQAATVSRTGEVVLWNLRTRQRILTLGKHKVEATEVGFSKSGRVLVSSGWDGVTQLWDSASGDHLLSLHGKFDSFSHDDLSFDIFERGLGGSRYRIVESEVFRARTLEMDSKGPWNLSFTHDSQWIAASCINQGAVVWAVGGQAVAQVPAGWTQSVHFDSQKRLLCASEGYGLVRWPLSVQSLDRNAIGPPQRIDPSPAQLLAVSRDGTVTALSHSSGEIRIRHKADVRTVQHRGVSNLGISPDGSYVGSATWRGRDAVVWSAASGEELFRVPCAQASVHFSRCGRRFGLTSADGCRIFEVGTWQEIRCWKWNDDLVWGTMCFSPDGEIVALKGSGSRIVLLHIDRDEVVAELVPPSDIYSFNSFAISPDYSVLAATSSNHRVVAWELGHLRSALRAQGLGLGMLSKEAPPRTVDRELTVLRGNRNSQEALSTSRRFLSAGHVLDRMREDRPELGPLSLMIQAKVAMQAEEYVDSLVALRALRKLRFTSPRVHMLIAEVLMWGGQEKEAEEYVGRSLKFAKSKYSRGQFHEMEYVAIQRKAMGILLGVRNVPKAISIARALVEFTPQSGEARDTLARALLGDPGRHAADAVREAKIAVARDSRCRSYRLTLARALVQLGDVQAAKECMKSLDPKGARAYPTDAALECVCSSEIALIQGNVERATIDHGRAVAWRKKQLGISAEMLLLRRELRRLKRTLVSAK